MQPALPFEQQMTVEEFLAFTETRPQEERWELIEGRPVLNPSPTNWHQTITLNIGSALGRIKLETAASWTPLLGIGTQTPLATNSLPQPDVMVLEHAISGEPSPVTDDALVLFEVLSRSNTKVDQAWRRRVYASIPNCRHYVTVSQRAVSVTRFDRGTQWQGVTLDRLADVLDFTALGRGASMPLAEIYRWTPLGG